MTITASYVRSILEYTPETGVFRWKHRADTSNAWNGRNAGKIAGTLNDLGYRHIAINNTRYLAHRLAWLVTYGAWPEHDLDHEDCDPGNNRLVNIRRATRSQNQYNIGIRTDNTSGVKGVSFYKPRQLWRSYIKIDGKRKHLGYFKTLEEAALVRSVAAHEGHGQFARAS